MRSRSKTYGRRCRTTRSSCATSLVNFLVDAPLRERTSLISWIQSWKVTWIQSWRTLTEFGPRRHMKLKPHKQLRSPTNGMRSFRPSRLYRVSSFLIISFFRAQGQHDTFAQGKLKASSLREEAEKDWFTRHACRVDASCFTTEQSGPVTCAVTPPLSREGRSQKEEGDKMD